MEGNIGTLQEVLAIIDEGQITSILELLTSIHYLLWCILCLIFIAIVFSFTYCLVKDICLYFYHFLNQFMWW